MNTCDPNALCQDTDESYVCICPSGFIDQSPDPVSKPGQRCIAVGPTLTLGPLIARGSNSLGSIIQCGKIACDPALGEICIGGKTCGCNTNFARRNPRDKCQPSSYIDFTVTLARRGDTPLFWTESYGNPQNVRFMEIAENFQRGIASVYQSTLFAPYFLTSEVQEILNPRTIGSSSLNSDTGGLLTKYRVYYCIYSNNAHTNKTL